MRANWNFEGTEETKSGISTLELRRLLFDLKDKRADVCVRFRILGEMWYPSFLRIIQVTEKGAVFANEQTNEWISLADLSEIMQFEIDNRFQHYQPHFHYDVMPVLAD
ncbi:MAG TPA: hypothetical protein VG737_00855 [Cyclobacteriaceae bacterium]|nr:hypothetical protein [Cyclobacteriaceae bacterium]